MCGGSELELDLEMKLDGRNRGPIIPVAYERVASGGLPGGVGVFCDRSRTLVSSGDARERDGDRVCSRREEDSIEARCATAGVTEAASCMAVTVRMRITESSVSSMRELLTVRGARLSRCIHSERRRREMSTSDVLSTTRLFSSTLCSLSLSS